MAHTIRRQDMKKIIRARSFWKIDARKGNYFLPNGIMLSDYVYSLLDQQLDLDGMAVNKELDCVACVSHPNSGCYETLELGKEGKKIPFDEEETNRNELVKYILGGRNE